MNRRPLVSRWTVACALLVLPVVGCKRGTTHPVVPTAPINVIVVLKTGEQIGGANNRGCRLTRAQMTEYLDNLNTFCRAHWQFQISFPGQGNQVNPVVFEDQNLILLDLPGQPGARRYPIDIWLLAALPTAVNLGLWDINEVNIFFTGNVQVDINQPSNTRANTVDPSDAQAQVVRHLFINDLGFVNGNAQVIPGWHVLEHEFCHYLIRQKSTQNGRYTSTEHTFNPNANQLMRPTTAHPAVVVPQDAQEVMQRARAGLWNAP